ncbi:hypothetical protein AXG93_2253s1220 [Marchantia polymorpha subsp. ruderalis]|uniref:Uncharacterized protein n=1 Tax=Marchantia polymorpha subsp. ruderalis TaxID=1480154 RepID=A0A176VTI9_MARPO|nr:hypothetical protein AXG93_2253s1220 [Marchantia polymorpha subsp. ruderalis]
MRVGQRRRPPSSRLQRYALGGSTAGNCAFGRSAFGERPVRGARPQGEGGRTCAFGTAAFGSSAFGATALVVTNRACGANLSKTGSPTALGILAGSSAAVAEADAMQPNSRESPGNSMATEILDLEDDGEEESGSDEEEEQSVKGTPTAALCEQVVPLLRYLDRKVTKYADPRQPGSYVELVRRRTRTKVRTSKLLARLDEDIKDLRLKNEALRGHIALSRKLQKVVDQTRDEKFEEEKKEFAKEKAKLADELDSEQTQNQILLEELRAEAELQLVVVEDDRRQEADRTKGGVGEAKEPLS